MTPPGRDAASRTRTRRPRRCASNAAASPAIPPPITIRSRTSARGTVNVLREALYVFDGRGGQEPVSQVEDVARPPVDPFEDVLRLREHALQRPEEQRRIEISLDGAIEADAFPRDVDGYSPVGA